jgi:hypothetical protein
MNHCSICGAPISAERYEARGAFCTAPACVAESLEARSKADPMVLVLNHKQGYVPMFLSDAKTGVAKDPKKDWHG